MSGFRYTDEKGKTGKPRNGVIPLPVVHLP